MSSCRVSLSVWVSSPDSARTTLPGRRGGLVSRAAHTRYGTGPYGCTPRLTDVAPYTAAMCMSEIDVVY